MEIFVMVLLYFQPIVYEAEKQPIQQFAEVTAYTNSRQETDDTPNIMASGERVYEGAIACPRYIPLKTKVGVLGETYICEDRMNKKYRDRFDIFMFDRNRALQFGIKYIPITVYN